MHTQNRVNVRRHFGTAVVAFSAIFFASWFGILTRDLGHLALLWPANAIALGLLIRFRSMATAPAMAGMLAGYMLPDLLTGSSLYSSTLLTAGNIAGVLPGYLLSKRFDESVVLLKKPGSVPAVILMSLAASLGAGAAGAVIDPLLFDGSPGSGWKFWFATELANYLTFLPAILTFPTKALELRKAAGPASRSIPGIVALPLVALVASAILPFLVGGPLSIVFPLPALLWCAVSYGVFEVSVLALLYGAWIMLALPSATIGGEVIKAASRDVLLTIRLGVSFLMLGPLTVASVVAARHDLLRQTRLLADYDSLSGVLNRRAFLEEAETMLSKQALTTGACALLMLDIDRFKLINDTYGHSAGDKVLADFARQLGFNVRQTDVIGRLGGEEFVILLPGSDREEARLIAERIRFSVSLNSTELDDGRSINFTVSIGGAFAPKHGYEIGTLIKFADASMYEAKRAGRDRVVFPSGRDPNDPQYQN